MTDRNLSTSRRQVFGIVDKGTECRLCGRNVTDGRSVYCSDYCKNIAKAVMDLLNWQSVRRRIIDRDDRTCQECGFDQSYIRRGNDHLLDIIESKLFDRIDGPSITDHDAIDEYDWEAHRALMKLRNELKSWFKDRYGDPYERYYQLEVDHITPISKGGHPFDPENLRTLCSESHERRSASLVERLVRGLDEPVSDGFELGFVRTELVVERYSGVDYRPGTDVGDRSVGLTDGVAEERRPVGEIEPRHVFDVSLQGPGLKVCARGQEELSDLPIGDGSVRVLATLDILVLNEVFESVAYGASARVVLLLEFDDQVSNHVAAVCDHLVEELVRQRRLSGPRHSTSCCFRHISIDHVAKNHSSCPRGEELSVVGHTANNMEMVA